MQKSKIKIGKWYKIKFNGYHNGEYVGKYQGIGQCSNEPDFGIVSFDNLIPKAGGLNSGSYSVDDIIREVNVTI